MASFFPDRENYTKTWGPLLESAGVTWAWGRSSPWPPTARGQTG